MSKDLFVGDMIVLADENETIGIEFLFKAEIVDFCEKWKKSNAKLVWLEEGYGKVSLPMN